MLTIIAFLGVIGVIVYLVVSYFRGNIRSVFYSQYVED
jgi:hypothetical protein